MEETKFCSHCGEKIAKEAVICPKCGCQVAATAQQAAPSIIINNANQNQVNAPVAPKGKVKNKWVALLLWFFLGFLGGHKFYEDKIVMGILYFFTWGFFGIGLFIDFWVLLFKPTEYYV